MGIHDDELARILADDCPFSDLTTEGLGIAHVRAHATLTARHDMIVCGVEEAGRMFELAGATARLLVKTGERVAAGAPLLEATGSGGALHRTYKMAQTLIETLSGISTATRAIVDAARSANPACPRYIRIGIGAGTDDGPLPCSKTSVPRTNCHTTGTPASVLKRSIY